MRKFQYYQTADTNYLLYDKTTKSRNRIDIRYLIKIILFIILLVFLIIIFFRDDILLKLSLHTSRARYCSYCKNPSQCYDIYAITKGDENYCVSTKCLINFAYKKKDITICGKLPTDEDRTTCYTDIIQIANDIIVCNKIPENKIKNFCYKYFALKTARASICKRIKDNNIKSSCFLELAEKENNPNLCRYINNTVSHDQCIYYLAKKNKNYLICFEIIELKQQQLCKKELEGFIDNYNICLSAKPEIRDICLLTYIKYHPDTEVCEEIQIQSKDMCYISIAEKSGNISICYRLSDENKRICIIRVAGSSGNLTHCKIFNSRYYRDECYFDIAVKTRDSDVCNSISDISLKHRCISRLLKETADVNLCGRLEVEKIDSCYRSYLIKITNLTYCNNIVDKYWKNMCKIYVALNTEDISICEMTGHMKDNCYFEIAYKKADATICKKISKIHLKSLCLAKISSKHPG